jgi:hypothetical protein
LRAKDGATLLQTPQLLRDAGYSFREVIDSKALWQSWGQPPNNPLKIIIFSNKAEAAMINGYVTYQVASDIISDSPSDSDNQSEVHDEIQPEPESPRSGTGSSLDSEDEGNDEGGKGMHTDQPAQSAAMEVTEDMATAGGDQLSMEDHTASILPTAFVNVRVSCHALTLAAMPNIREKDVSISARNHEPDSFEQFVDTHDRMLQDESF